MIRAAILTLSDKGSRGEREDKSGEVIRNMLKEIDATITNYEVIPDEKEIIIKKLFEFSEKADLVVTTGGTGVGPRDVTPEATRAVIEKELPGFAEAMRMEGIKHTPGLWVPGLLPGSINKHSLSTFLAAPRVLQKTWPLFFLSSPHYRPHQGQSQRLC